MENIGKATTQHMRFGSDIMNTYMKWLKEGLQRCVNLGEASEEENRTYFADLEKRYNAFTMEEKESVRNILAASLDVNDWIYVLSCFVSYMHIQDFQEDVIEGIIKGKFDCCTGSMLELQVIYIIHELYSKKRRLHRKNIERYTEELNFERAYLPVEGRNRKRIVLVTEQLLDIRHAPTKIVLNYAYILQRYLNYEVMIFACPTDGGLPIDLWYGNKTVESRSDTEFLKDPIRIRYKEELLEGYQINMSTGECLKEYSMMLSLIHAWNPLFVFNMGITNPVAEMAGRFTTVAEMGMVLGCPVSEAQILVRIGKKDEASEKEYTENLSKEQVQLFMEEQIPVIDEVSEQTFTREELGLPLRQFLIAIVGNRLDVEVDDEFIDVMKKILRLERSIAFVIIGKAEKLKIRLNTEEFNDKVIYMGYCANLTGVYGCMDLYLNPRRSGGGFSSAMALKKGLPVVTLPFCDVAYNCGDNFVVEDYKEMVDAVLQYVADDHFRFEKMQRAQEVAEKDTEQQLIRYVETMIDNIVSIIGERGVLPEA